MTRPPLLLNEEYAYTQAAIAQKEYKADPSSSDKALRAGFWAQGFGVLG